MTRALCLCLVLGVTVSCGGKKVSSNPMADCDTGLCSPENTLYAASTVSLVGAISHGQSLGFHLAGADTGACPSSNFTSPTGAVVDNQIANVLPVLYSYIGDALPTLIQNAVNDGGIALVLEFVGSPYKDGTVDLVVHQGKGAPVLGADNLLLADQTLGMEPQPPLGECLNGKISNGTFTCGPYDTRVPIVVFGVSYEVTFLGAYITMTLPADGSDAQILMGGAVSVANIQAVANTAGPAAGNLTPVVMNVVPSLADVQDPKTAQCDRISGALAMTARIVFGTVAN